MCEKCGCGSGNRTPRPAPSIPHHHGQVAGSEDLTPRARLADNDRHAEWNRGFARARRCFVLNLLSFGSSRAAELAARAQAAFGPALATEVLDAGRLQFLGAVHGHAPGPAEGPVPADFALPAIDAHMIGHALDLLDLDGKRVLLIVNGGSAACQAAYDLGENARAVVFSVREGEKKPLKAPLVFRGAGLVLINDSEAAGICGFDRAAALANIREVAPAATVIEVSAATGAGLSEWRAWLQQRILNTEH
jgi:hydrogenase nickel incorporation protein HypB